MLDRLLTSRIVMGTVLWRLLAASVLVLTSQMTLANGRTKLAEKEIEQNKSESRATFAGGCFWCMEGPFEKIDGVKSVVSGYTGGKIDNPTYEQVSSGSTDHVEAVVVFYDASKVRYEDLLEVFWKQVNPTDSGGQFVDRGPQYATGIFVHSAEQKRLATQSKEALDSSGVFSGKIVTPIRDAGRFYPAEDYHQDYYKTNPIRYNFYRKNSGRDQYLKKIWSENRARSNTKTSSTKGNATKDWRKRMENYSKPATSEIRTQLTPLQFKVTQKDGTERPFKNEFWDSKKEGIYVDIVSGEPLFSSKDKYDSGTGWPSFYQPLINDHIIEKEDRSLFRVRTEVRSKHGDSHLGHVFNDGPKPTGLRYCINSASMKFIPREDLDKEGYGEFKKLFD